jgi:hypothetical protein
VTDDYIPVAWSSREEFLSWLKTREDRIARARAAEELRKVGAALDTQAEMDDEDWGAGLAYSSGICLAVATALENLQ